MENMSIETVIISVIIMGAMFVFLYNTGQKDKIRKKAIELAETAQKQFGDGDELDGIKHDYVVQELNKWIPESMKHLVSDKLIDQFIDDAFYALKDKLDDDQLNNSYKK